MTLDVLVMMLEEARSILGGQARVVASDYHVFQQVVVDEMNGVVMMLEIDESGELLRLRDVTGIDPAAADLGDAEGAV